ncbi:DUF3854 domain-containing protein [Sphaerospermopsis aphanizomenoides BCCUSP55]|uniref:VapE domain-containing protein n=1 Tax=Sphaerospermopsis aphanizomenoides TaxID=459663 RepID=UPI001907775E|nr:VapE domain-containing protein [Sphaerospermopsis aphanizomenoides]MBK1986955.1 DUF3854 domain-containing protein [Sphaerospermopsis aphanizomenoides BCCUSP55]
MALTANEISIDTLEGLSIAREIPTDLLLDNVKRSGKGYILKGDNDQIQYRPDKPFSDKDGKPIKYVTPKGKPYDAMIPVYEGMFGIVHYVGKNDRLWIVEGFFKALSLIAKGIYAIAICGVTMGLTPKRLGEPQLVPALRRENLKGITKVGIIFDGDIFTNTNVFLAQRALAKKLIAAGYDVLIASGTWVKDRSVPVSDKEKGIDDYINHHKLDTDGVKALLEKAYSLDEWERRYPVASNSSKSRKSGGNSKSHAKTVSLLAEFYRDRIRLNQMTNEIEKDGKEYYIDSSFIHISQETGIELAKSYAIDYLVEVARQKAYHPVIEYLNSIKDKAVNISTDDALPHIHKMLSEITGVQDKLHLTFITKTLVAAVNRVFRPGCFFKRVCVFYGKQDAGKSSFWRELAGDKFFNSSYKGTTDKDDLMALHSAWVNEIAEFDKVYRKTDVANLKAVISDPFDKVRLPYGRTIQTLYRRSILVASTNKQDILLDPTGHTRFWVVDIPGKIDFKSLLEYRDLIWACAYKLFESGYSYELSEDEQIASAANNERYTSFDPLFDAVEDACRVVGWIKDSEEYVTISEIYTHLYPESDGKALKPGDWKPISDALTRLGYTSGHKVRRNGKTTSVWKLKKVEDFTVTTVTEAESHAGQALPLCYRPVTDTQPAVTDVPKTLPSDVHGNATVTPTVTPTVQGLQPSVTAVTVESPTFSDVMPSLPSKTPLPNGMTEVDPQPEVGDWVEIISDTYSYPCVKGAKFEVSEVCPGYGVKLFHIKKGTAKKNPSKVVLAPVSFKDVRLVEKQEQMAF